MVGTLWRVVWAGRSRKARARLPAVMWLAGWALWYGAGLVGGGWSVVVFGAGMGSAVPWNSYRVEVPQRGRWGVGLGRRTPISGTSGAGNGSVCGGGYGDGGGAAECPLVDRRADCGSRRRCGGPGRSSSVVVCGWWRGKSSGYVHAFPPWDGCPTIGGRGATRGSRRCPPCSHGWVGDGYRTVRRPAGDGVVRMAGGGWYGGSSPLPFLPGCRLRLWLSCSGGCGWRAVEPKTTQDVTTGAGCGCKEDGGGAVCHEEWGRIHS